MTTFNPDHNGECTHCDEPGDAHMCPTADDLEAQNQIRTVTLERDEARAQFDRHVEWAAAEAPTLNEAQERAAKSWAADDRLWTTQETVEFNLRVFAREILSKR